ncbi:MAG: GNVR domain-containing protein [Pseudomonadota bacterium]
MYEVGAPPAASQTATTPHDGTSAAQPAPAAPSAAAPGNASPLSEIWRRKGLITLIALLTAAAAVAVGSLFAPRYNAFAQLIIDPSELRIVDRGLRNTSQLNEAMIAEVETQTRVLLSTKVLRRVVREENLIDDPEFVSDAPVTPIDHLRLLLKRSGLRSEEDTGPPDLELTALRTLEERVWAQRQERTFVVNLGVWSSDRQKSVRLVDAIVQAFLEEQQNTTSGAARQAFDSLAARLEGLKQRVIESEQAVETFKRENNILSASGQLVNEQQLTAVSGQLIQARTRRAQAEARNRQIEQIRRSGDDVGSIPEATGSQTLAALRGQLASAERREAEMSAQLLPRHPAAAQARQEVARLRREVNSEVNRVASSIGRDVQRARDSETTLSETLNDIKNQLTKINQKQVQLRELERDVEANRRVYEAFLLRTQEIGQQEKIEVPNTRVISPAIPPKNKSLPPSKLLLAVGGFGLGTGLGMALALALQFAGFGVRRRVTQPVPEATSFMPPQDTTRTNTAKPDDHATQTSPVEHTARTSTAGDTKPPTQQAARAHTLTDAATDFDEAANVEIVPRQEPVATAAALAKTATTRQPQAQPAGNVLNNYQPPEPLDTTTTETRTGTVAIQPVSPAGPENQSNAEKPAAPSDQKNTFRREPRLMRPGAGRPATSSPASDDKLPPPSQPAWL